MGLGKPNLRLGQFVVPFGNLAYYETHTRPLQSLYPESLGIRIDRGASLEGFLGDCDYWLAVVGGNGARSDNGGGTAWIGRAARRFDLSAGALVAGASVLWGKDMPRFSVLADPFMDEEMRMEEMPLLDFTDKTRVGFDAEFSAGRDVFRAEMVLGRDSDGPANGQFVQWERALTDRLDISAQAARWEQEGGRKVRLGGSARYRIVPDRVSIGAALERTFAYTPEMDEAGTVATLQLIFEWPGFLKK